VFEGTGIEGPDEMIERVVVIVLDSVGCGAAPDADRFGDRGAHTLRNTAEAAGGLDLPHLGKLGLGRVASIRGVAPAAWPKGAWGRMTEVSAGKDTTTGHWEMAGLVLDKPFALFPDGFPVEIMHRFEQETGRKAIGNRAASGTEIIQDLGAKHLKTGALIIYTSADSVFQIAAHEEKVPIEELYEACRIARRILDPYRVSRVIARPFVGEKGSFVRTHRRRDFSMPPEGPTCLDRVAEAGMEVVALGKIEDIYARHGVTAAEHSIDNMDGVDLLLRTMARSFRGLVMLNLVDFDTLWGHRRDAIGYAKGLEAFDRRLPEILARLAAKDALFITADHGCDPCHHGTDHTREQVPILAYGPSIRPGPLGVRPTFADLGQTICTLLGAKPVAHGKGFFA